MKHKKHDNHLAIMVLVSFVAILSLFAANNRNSVGSAVQEPIIECKPDTYCLEWEWFNDETLVCMNSEFAEYRECDSYSVLNGELICESWNIIYKNECDKWGLEDSWERVCVEKRVKEECVLVIDS